MQWTWHLCSERAKMIRDCDADADVFQVSLDLLPREVGESETTCLPSTLDSNFLLTAIRARAYKTEDIPFVTLIIQLWLTLMAVLSHASEVGEVVARSSFFLNKGWLRNGSVMKIRMCCREGVSPR
jgi:hypothetical protein